MTDANLDPLSQEAPMSLGVTYALIAWNGGTALEVRLDRAWMDDPARIYPLTVDPEIHNNASGDDTYVMSGFSRDNSYDAELKVGTYDGGAHIGRSYVKFDTSLLAGTTVQRAELHLAERHSWNCTYWPEPVYRVTQGWNGRDMRDFPGAAVDPNGIGGTWNAGPCGSRDAQWDVTGIAAYWASVRELGGSLSLRATNEGDNNRYKKYASTEAGAPPRLDVWYTNSAPAVPYNVSPPWGSVFASSPAVSATYSDPDGGQGALAFGVWTYGSNQLVWSQWSSVLCSGCGASFQLPPLTPGVWYYVMVIAHDGVNYSGGNLSPTWSSPNLFFIDVLAPSLSEVTPANGATGVSPTQLSARYSEPWGFPGTVYFWLRTTGGASILEASPVAATYGAVAAKPIAALAAGTYNVWAMASDGRQNGAVVGPNMFTVTQPTTTTSSTTSTSTTVAPTTTTVPTTTTTTTIPPPAAPSPPANVRATPGDQQVGVTWDQSDPHGATVTLYTVTASPGGATGTSPGGGTATVTGLTNGTAYTFTVVASNAVGQSAPSVPSNAVTPAGLPGPPSNVQAVLGDRQATVTWGAAAGNGAPILGYTVTAYPENQDPGPSVEVDGSATSGTTTGLDNVTRYYFSVAATNTTGTGPSRESAVLDSVKYVADGYMIGSLGDFLSVRGTTESGPGAGPPPYEWSADGCSLYVSEYQVEYYFHNACLRHDFGYRNYGNGLRLGRDEDTKAWIDNIFRQDMIASCDHFFPPDQATCLLAAESVYAGERNSSQSHDAFYGT